MTKIIGAYDVRHTGRLPGEVDWDMTKRVLISLIVGIIGGCPLILMAQPVTIYLTVDDGPSQGSRQLYALADSQHIKVSLFIIGRHAVRADSIGDLFRQYRTDSLLQVCNHSYSHANGHYRQYYQDAMAVVKDFDLNRDTLGLNNPIARMPGRNYWRLGKTACGDIPSGAMAADSLAAHGYRVYGWDVEWKYDTLPGGGIRTGKDMLALVERMVRSGQTLFHGNIVLLMHDAEFAEEGFCKEVHSFIQLAGQKGFRFAHLSEYPGD